LEQAARAEPGDSINVFRDTDATDANMIETHPTVA
jgi:hypothetical protein